MTDALIALAKNGDPNTEAVSWPEWKPADERLVEFGDQVRVLPVDTRRAVFMAAHPVAAGPRRAARD